MLQQTWAYQHTQNWWAVWNIVPNLQVALTFWTCLPCQKFLHSDTSDLEMLADRNRTGGMYVVAMAGVEVFCIVSRDINVRQTKGTNWMKWRASHGYPPSSNPLSWSCPFECTIGWVNGAGWPILPVWYLSCIIKRWTGHVVLIHLVRGRIHEII